MARRVSSPLSWPSATASMEETAALENEGSMALLRKRTQGVPPDDRRARRGAARHRPAAEYDPSESGSGRIQPALEERWEEAWRRARAADLR